MLQFDVKPHAALVRNVPSKPRYISVLDWPNLAVEVAF